MNNRCFNHPDRKAISLCHSCKRYFCSDCLAEGSEFYYCKEQSCQSNYKKEMACSKETKSEYVNMSALYSPSNETELAFIVSLLEGDKIPYFTHNDHFGSLQIGPSVDLFNKKTIMIDEANIQRARELLSDYLKNTKEDDEKKPPYSFSQKIRMIAEALFFTWFIPGRRHKKIGEKNS